MASMLAEIPVNSWWLRMQWLVGRSCTAQLQRTCGDIWVRIRADRFRHDVWILHAPLSPHGAGFRDAHRVDVAWLMFALHLAADHPPTEDDTIIVLCPTCRSRWTTYMYAAVRYRFSGHLEWDSLITLQSEARDLESSTPSSPQQPSTSGARGRSGNRSRSRSRGY